jgi:hypothetical protein
MEPVKSRAAGSTGHESQSAPCVNSVTLLRSPENTIGQVSQDVDPPAIAVRR